MSRIADMFARTKSESRPALIAYLTAGDPEPSRTAEMVFAMERGGADLIELGVPFSDPIADGPVIQRASDRALRAGTSMRAVLEIARQVRQRSEIPLLLFTYLNPTIRYGFERLASDAASAGIDGCLLTDLSVEEAKEYVQACRGAGMDTVFLVAPTSTERRLKLVAEYSSGFVYLVSRTGVTGEQQRVSSQASDLVARTRAVTDLPLAVGFGISTAAQVAEVGAIADGVVVGSAIVREIETAGNVPDLEHRLEQFLRGLSGGLARRATP
ncbi:MAG TPA: tryptophan synthase subunit alpha [Bryobacteraceae bacterium]|nr:tryptophan synthase subunit alpha [Bryobacteraceae bacterium]